MALKAPLYILREMFCKARGEWKNRLFSVAREKGVRNE